MSPQHLLDESSPSKSSTWKASIHIALFCIVAYISVPKGITNTLYIVQAAKHRNDGYR
ncbi:hypothetical protein PAXRUDRAFT_826077 [Paxillus rubicundulus Ve08.2h10]|uniref:Uncharacterized protein n=1 Tax=Paxillus rubicundulus Ve08.2h10 TaxID=930991 RepID=A0A0D0EA54_9AGAM|nr:hypothetical protein PAXRUDRAFT_826077 [Paxillus rubicundulus Ve08.2h10]